MAHSAEIYSITYKPLHSVDKPDGFLRVSVDHATLLAGYGIEGDRKGGHPKRQINLIGKSTLDALRAKGYNTQPGAMGEQMIVSGIDVDDLPVGTLIQLGESATVEVTGVRAGCAKFETTQGFCIEDTIGQMGVMVRVIAGGQVHTGDSLTILSELSAMLEHG